MKPPVLSARFTWADVQASATAVSKGIDNALPDDLAVNAARTCFALECVEGLVGPVTVTSWYRCLALNTAVGGSKTSAHMKGLAVDFQPKDVTLVVAYERIRASSLPFDQVIIERTATGAAWIHLGLSEGKPRREALSATGTQGNMTFQRVAAG